uniref:C-type lectin domain containing 16A n=1 Tax=Sander lucioperca TaxID=283035 RepID=A0A8C9YUU0_SANLU
FLIKSFLFSDYLLSNNHVNSIIVHKFDFSDEEIMAYYISFLKTLSLKLNNHTVHFFYNEHTNDFALYTEAIKFFNHPESMVRIAVRTITLNVYKVDNQHMLHYIRDKTAVPYFSNLVWFIGSHVIELDKCVQTDEEHRNRGKLSDLVAEHLDHLHYLNDILIINCEFLNDVLTDHLLNRLFLPLYVYSLVIPETSEERKINPQVSLYLLSQVFLIIHYQPMVNALAEVILNGDLSVFTPQTDIHSTHKNTASAGGVRCFTKPLESLERSLELSRHRGRKRTQKRPNYKNLGEEEDDERARGGGGGVEEGWDDDKIEMVVMDKCKVTEQNITDEEKTAAATRTHTQRSRPFLDMVYSALDCTNDDYHALFVLCLLYAVSHSKGINRDLLERLQLPVPDQEKSSYSLVLVERLIRVMSQASQPDGKVRLATLELSCLLLKQSVLSGNQCIIKDVHLACLEVQHTQTCTHYIRTHTYSPGEEIFLDMFEDEYRSMTSKPLNVEYLMMDASVLLPPTGTPLTGIDFVKRLPCGDVEKTRRAIRVFFMLRSLSLQLQGEPETQLKTHTEKQNDLIACMVVSKDGGQAQRFLAVDVYQMSLVEPETKRLGWGVVKFAGLLQDMQVSGVEDDSRALNIVIHKPSSNPHAKPLPILQANFIFADHIRCIIAKQRLAKGRIQARRMKMQRIAALLDLPVQPSATEVLGFGQTANASPSGLPFRFYEQSRRGPNDPTANRAVFASVDKVPDDGTFLDHTPPSASGGEGEGVGGEVMLVASTPSAPPNISLLTDNNAETLSVESLTLLPPAGSPHLHPCASHIPAAHSLQRPDASIAEEEEEEEGDRKEEQREEEGQQEEEGSPMDETETDATVKEETTTAELVTPTDEEPEGVDKPEGEDTPLEVNIDQLSAAELQERDDSEYVENTEDTEMHTDTQDSPELD